MNEIDLLHVLNRTNGEFRRLLHLAMDKSEYEGMRGNGRLLHELHRLGEPVSQKELAQRLDIRPQSLTQALVKLEDAGYITRSRSGRDKREQYVSITETGCACAQELRELRFAAASHMFGCLTQAEKEQLSALLTKVVDESSRYTEEE